MNMEFSELFDAVKDLDTDNLTLPVSDNTVTGLTKQHLEFFAQYKELRMMYACALKEIKTKFEVLDTEFSVRNSRNPIESISTRLKTNASIMKKMKKRNVPMTLEGMRENVHDIAGVRVICSYIDDIYMLAEALKSQNDITLVSEKDYIKNPKPTGYRSLHLVVSVPVFFANNKTDMTVEVQIRTIAMNFWASLEHEMKYKRAISANDDVSMQLRSCAETIAEVDQKMLSIRKNIDKKYMPTETELLLKKLQKKSYALI
ncbi:MAG: GTP pyrophosphokinase family protein [Clostridia bacterium]|nr:GTP pyrophosphokinase family protein [Clostridia bacterium]